MIMIVAFSTSTPTSITVVATIAWISPTRNRSMIAARSSRLSLPCIASSRHPFIGPACSIARCDCTSFNPAEDSSIAGTTMYAWSPAFSCFAANSYTSADRAPVAHRVMIGIRPGGSVRIVEMSRSPNAVNDSVLGIGVAVITSTCGLDVFSPRFDRSANR